MKVSRSLTFFTIFSLFGNYGVAKGKSTGGGQVEAPAAAPAAAKVIRTVKDYNDDLPYWGSTWTPQNSLNPANGAYHPSFYTGFAPRQEAPDRIHVRQARGNVTRLTVILDDQTLVDYLFDLTKRAKFIKSISNLNGGSGPFRLLSENNAFPHASAFVQIVEGDNYKIPALVDQAKAGKASREEIYAKALELISEFNPNRVFNVKLNLTKEFARWKKFLAASGINASNVTSPVNAIAALDSVVWGRVNYVGPTGGGRDRRPSGIESSVMQKLVTAVKAATDGSDAELSTAAVELFKTATGNKFNFKVLVNGQWQNPVQCAGPANCFLVYPEFTTMYPTGTVKDPKVPDEYGNPINPFASSGLWVFNTFNYKDFESIPGPGGGKKDEPWYGWIPKMFYDPAGQAYHNPGIKMDYMSKADLQQLGAPLNHRILWAVKRGPVSHGCSRLASGHAWEMRHIFPVEPAKANLVSMFINRNTDFDIYDPQGDGELKVMSVEYMITYEFKGNYESREAGELKITPDRKVEYYTKLFGNVFESNGENIDLIDPPTSFVSYLDWNKHGVSARANGKSTNKLPGKFRLYDQTYEKDKLQLYGPLPDHKYIFLSGEVRGCAPTSDKNACGEAYFDARAASIYPAALR